MAVSPSGVTIRPDGNRPTGLRTVGANRPTSQPFGSASCMSFAHS